MKKKTSSIIKLVIIGLVAILGAILCTCSWYVPGTFNKRNSYASSIKLGLDLKGGMYAVYEAKSDGVQNFDEKLASTQTRLTALLAEKGYDAIITTEGGTNLRVEVPDVENPEAIFDLVGDPCQVVFAIDDKIVMYGKDPTTGEQYITGAEAYYEASQGNIISLELTSKGQTIFGDITSENTGKQMGIYLVYDEDYENFATTGTLLMNPSINSPIYTNPIITGNFTAEQASNYATQIESGTFSLTLSLIESSVMPATLGEEALSTGIIAGLIGILIVVLFLIWRYRLLGVVATLSLAIYAELMIFFLAFTPWVQLTLSGIAGIILSLGMAVDGNVIIYERIKDEYRAGKSLTASYHTGFNKSVSAIFDGNITTILAAVVLMIFGIGTIKGFGITLLIGIILSLFTSLVLNRFLVKAFINLAPDNGKLFSLKREAVEELAGDDKAEDVTQEEAAEENIEEKPEEEEVVEAEEEKAEETEESVDSVDNEEAEGGNE